MISHTKIMDRIIFMIRLTPKSPSKGLKRTPLKRKPFKGKIPTNHIKSPKKIGSVSLRRIKKAVAKNPPKKRKGLTIRIDPLDSLVSEYVRKRTKGFCERCGKYYGWQNLQACHFHSRRKISVRYDSDNLAGCDFGCHNWLDGNPMEKIEFFQNRLGQVKFDLLNSRARITFPRPDKKMLTLYYQHEINKLEIST
jgi:hypothetical protein